MIELKLINPKDEKFTTVEKAIAAGGVVDAFVTLGVLYTLVEIGQNVYRLVKRYFTDYGRLQLTENTITLVADDESRIVTLSDLDRLELYYYDSNSIGFGEKFKFSTVVLYLDEEYILCQTEAGKSTCKDLLRHLYTRKVNVKEYLNDSRSFELRIPKYKEIQELKARFDPPWSW